MTDLTWHRPLFEGEVMMEHFHQQNFMLTCYRVTLNSSQPLQNTHLRQAFSLLYRKVPNLRVCIRSRGPTLWFVEMPEEKVDFQVLEDADPEEEYTAITLHRYNSFDGPLWCARLIPAKEGTPCSMPEVGQSFPHQYSLLLGFHHGITDGTSTFTICGFLLSLLNDVIAGRLLDDKVQLADFVPPVQTKKLVEEHAEYLESDPEHLQELKDEFVRRYGKALIRTAYPVPKGIIPRTLNITKDLDEATTKKFLQKCRSEGVTFHTAFSAICSVAMVDLLIQAGLEQDSYDITSLHLISARRYWEGDTKLAFGNHIMLFHLHVPTSKESQTDFWNYARSLNINFRDGLEKKGPLTTGYLMEWNTGPNQAPKHTFDPCFTTTNMGNVDKMFPGDGDHVQATHIMRTTSNHKLDAIFSHVMQTFRGRFLYGIDYVTSCVSKETTQLYVDTIFSILHSLI